MKRALLLVAMLLPVTSLTCAPSSAMAAPRHAPMFPHGKAPSRPMEVLGDMVVEMGSASGKQAAVEALRQKAMALGADAVLDLVVETAEREVPVNQFTGLPMAVMGTLLGLATGNPTALKDAMDSARVHVLKRPVTVVRGVAVKYVR